MVVFRGGAMCVYVFMYCIQYDVIPEEMGCFIQELKFE